jgi:hypothetical protein
MNVRNPVTGGLTVPKNVGVSETEQQNIHGKWDTIENVENELAMEGFVPMGTPEFECPQVTEDALTTPDSKEYTTTYARQLAWFNYSSQVLARVTAHLLQIENEMDFIESKLRKQFREVRRPKESGKGFDKMSAEEMKDEIRLDPRYSELTLQAQVFKQKKTELSVFVEGIERGLKVISRQVEIRKMEIEQGRVNIPNRGYGVRTP